MQRFLEVEQAAVAPAPVDQDWRAMGLCAGGDPDLWFSVGAFEHKQAKMICRRCPVKRQCLTYAMEAPVDHGIWGGMTERERRRHRRTAPGGDWRAVVS
ncbi:MAG: WhiB family transcriptional regulator [Actinomycetota bacterium]|nr:WhiB family transcriptional regulator [Actinomycetota bacterium]